MKCLRLNSSLLKGLIFEFRFLQNLIVKKLINKKGPWGSIRSISSKNTNGSLVNRSRDFPNIFHVPPKNHTFLYEEPFIKTKNKNNSTKVLNSIGTYGLRFFCYKFFFTIARFSFSRAVFILKQINIRQLFRSFKHVVIISQYLYKML